MASPPDLKTLDRLELESGVNEDHDGFCIVRAIADDGTVLYGQTSVAEMRQQARSCMECAEAAESDALILDMLTEDVGLSMEAAGQFIARLRERRASDG